MATLGVEEARHKVSGFRVSGLGSGFKVDALK